MKRIILPLLLILISAVSLSAQTIIVTSDTADSEIDLDYTHVMKVKAVKNAETWRLDVTIRHGDTGWDHYADLWVVTDSETGEEYGRRVLAHPHVNEQPFTRSQSGIVIPDEVKTVIVKASCNLHGFGGTEILVELQ